MAPVVEETTWISARVPADLSKQLADLAEKHDRSVSAELRRALKAHVERETAPTTGALERELG